jgi:ATP-binding cassette, subfamily F, member 3
VLLEAIANFTGTVLFVSHDRYFIDGLATRVFEVEDRRVHIYPGNYEDYLWRKQGGPEKVTVSLTTSMNHAPIAVTILPIAAPEAAKTPIKRLNPIKQKQLEDELRKAEEAIPVLEEKIALAEGSLGAYTTAEEAKREAAELDRLRSEHAGLLARWEELGMQLEGTAE